MRITTTEMAKNPKLIDDVVTALRNGSVIAYPTDTVYGLGCSAYNATAIEKLYQMKKSDRQKPMSILCANLMDIHKQAHIQGFVYQIIRESLPGAYTILLPLKNPKLKILLGDNGKVGIRMPAHDTCQALVEKLGEPIVSTSANISGRAVIYFPQIIEETFPTLDYIIDDGVLISDPSSLVDLSNDFPQVIREGKGNVSTFL